MNEEALTVRREAGPPTVIQKRHLDIEGLEDLTLEEDLVLPRWRIVQYSSTIEGEPGQFNNNLTEELRNQLELIVLKVTPSRAYFDDDRKLVCMSRNGLHSTSGKPCFGCQFARWSEEGEPSPCSRGYTLICLDPEDGSLCLLGALRTSVPPVKLWFSRLAHEKTAPFYHLTRFVAVEERGSKGKYFVLTPETDGELSPEDRKEARRQYQFLATVRITEVEEPTYDEYEPGQQPAFHRPPPPEPADQELLF